MSQARFNTAEFLLNNKREIFETLQPELDGVLVTKEWWKSNGLLLSFEDAFADFVLYKIQWATVEHTGKSFEEVSSVMDKGFLVDLFGEPVLKSETWETK